MRDLPHVPDAVIDDVLAGRTPAGAARLEPVAAFVHELRSAVEEMPEPRAGGQLAALLGLEPVGAPRSSIIERSTEKMESLGRSLRAKIAAAVAIALTGTLGVGAAGALPGPAQHAADQAFEAVGLEREASDDTDELEDDAENDDVTSEDVETESEGEKPAGAGVDGAEISSEAQELEPGDGQEFGERVSTDASEHGTTTAGENSEGAGGSPELPEQAPLESVPPEDPGAQGGADAGSRPDSTPTGPDDNPGTQFRPGGED